MIITELKVVINNQYGGFTITPEMGQWLHDNKGWTLGKTDDYKNPEVDLYSYEVGGKIDSYHVPCVGGRFNGSHDFSLRSHPDFVECVRTLQEPHKDMYYYELRDAPQEIRELMALKIMTLEVSAEINDEYDGIENIGCSTWID